MEITPGTFYLSVDERLEVEMLFGSAMHSLAAESRKRTLAGRTDFDGLVVELCALPSNPMVGIAVIARLRGLGWVAYFPSASGIYSKFIHLELPEDYLA